MFMHIPHGEIPVPLPHWWHFPEGLSLGDGAAPLCVCDSLYLPVVSECSPLLTPLVLGLQFLVLSELPGQHVLSPLSAAEC